MIHYRVERSREIDEGDGTVRQSTQRRYVRVYTNEVGNTIAALVAIFGTVAILAAWCTHIVWIIGKLASDQGATLGQMGLGALGAFIPPVGVVHGFMIWFGIGM